ncbi:MAG: hypothetical protein OHK0021_23350 [Bryobacter sp.]
MQANVQEAVSVDFDIELAEKLPGPLDIKLEYRQEAPSAF